MIRIVTALARMVAGPHLPAPAGVALPPSVQLRASRLIPAVGGRLSGMGEAAAAVTLGRVVLVHPSVRPSPRLVRHELAHVAQWERHPITFPLRYVAAHIRHRYERNPYEIEARAAERGPSDREMPA